MDAEWVLVFDTETTGVGPDYKRMFNYAVANKIDEDLMRGELWFQEQPNKKTNISLWDDSRTYIAQLSYIMYNLKTNEYKLFNKFITDIPNEAIQYLLDRSRVPLDEEGELSDEVYATNPGLYTHPISVRTLFKMRDPKTPSENKAKIFDAISEFMRDVEKSQIVTAHNAAFDRRLVFSELARLKMKNPSSKMFELFKENQHKMYCTMCMSREIAHIDTKIVKGAPSRVLYVEKRRVYPQGSSRYELLQVPSIKYPALWEVYDRMFGYPLIEELMHDALNDVVACLRVFYRLWMTGNHVEPVNLMICGSGDPDIYGMDSLTGGEITARINSITPPGINPQGNFNPTKGLGLCFMEGKPYARIPKRDIYTWEQLERSEANRLAALERRASLTKNKRDNSEEESSKRRKKNSEVPVFAETSTLEIELGRGKRKRKTREGGGTKMKRRTGMKRKTFKRSKSANNKKSYKRRR